MARCTIKTPDACIDEAFGRLARFLEAYKIDGDRADAWAPGVCGYGIDKVTPLCQDTRDNRWMVWAARYSEPDEAFLRQATPSILQRAFDESGRELHEKAAPDADDYLHYYIWWLLQVALGFRYTGDATLDLGRIERIVDTMYRLFDAEDTGMLATQRRYFVTSIGEPFNTDAGRAYGFFLNCNLVYCLAEFAALAQTRGEEPSRRRFQEKRERTLAGIHLMRDQEGFFYVLRDAASGKPRYRVTGADSFCVLTDNVFFPLAFGVLSAEELKPSLDYLLPALRGAFPVPYAHPAYHGAGTMAWWIPRSWQECLVHYCLGSRELEMAQPIHDAIRRQARRFADDNEVWEHYDPVTGSPHGYPVPSRRGYATTAACLNIAIVETLFGVRPESPGFASVSIRPALPEAWPSASIDMVANGRRIGYTMRLSDREVSYDFSGSEPIPASLLLPLPCGWRAEMVQADVDGTLRVLKGEDRPCFSTRLTLGDRPIVLKKA